MARANRGERPRDRCDIRVYSLSMTTTTTSAEFEKATDYQFKEEDIERAKALVGMWAPAGSREHLTAATHDSMRNFARGYGDDNPLYGSESYGGNTRWGAQIAPPMLPIALNRPLYGRGP